MSCYVADTEALVWHMSRSQRLSRQVRTVFRAADEGRAQVLVPSIVLVEASFLGQRQRLSEALIRRVLDLPADPEATYCVVPLDAATARECHGIGPAVVPELADRIIVATARRLGLPLLTSDGEIEQSGLVKVIW